MRNKNYLRGHIRFSGYCKGKDNNYIAAKTFLEGIKGGKIRVKKIITSDYIIDETLTRIRYAVGHKEAERDI